MTFYVADTHALVWHLFNPKRLGPKARASFATIEKGEATLYIPLVVVAETSMVIERGRISATRQQFETVLQQMTNSQNYQIGQLHLEIVLAAMELTQLSGIFDRLIVAETQKLGCALITRDQEIV